MLGLGLSIPKNNRALYGEWTPAELTTELWLDAADIPSIIVNGSNVSQWNDKSGNDNHALQNTAALQPSYGTYFLNGLNTVTANKDYMLFNSDVPAVKSCFFVASDVQGSDSSTEIAIIIADSGTSTDHVFIRTNINDYDLSIDGGIGNSGNASVNGGSLVSGANIDLGMTIAEKSEDNMWYADFDNQATFAGIMAFNAGAAYRLIGSIGEVILLDFVPTIYERQRVEGYLAWKWGLQGKLPVGHPYKNEAPTI